MLATPRLTLDQFLSLPKEKPASEFVDGNVIQKPWPTLPHAILRGACISLLDPILRQKDYRPLPECRFVFGQPARSNVPDVSVINLRKLKTDSKGRFINDYFLVPDIAIEILLPGLDSGHLLDKLSFYVASGVELVLVVDGERKQTHVLRRNDHIQVVTDRLSLAPAIDDAELSLVELFAALRIR